jgi:hypothetical protein
VHIPSGLPISPGIQFDQFEGTANLAKELEQPEGKESCRLFIVENVCVQAINILGEKFDIDPQFFADHLNNERWYRIANVAERITALPSTQKSHDFLQLRYIEPSHRSFNRRASLLDEAEDTIPPTSNREALAGHLNERFSNNPSLLESAKSDCFFILGDVYRLVASNWVVINEYVNRELATIEYILEKEEPTFRDLEIYLKDLYIYRRRVTRYHELITQAKEQCTTRGQVSWSRDQICWKLVPKATCGNSAMQGHTAMQGHSAKHGFSVVIGAIWTCISIGLRSLQNG